MTLRRPLLYDGNLTLIGVLSGAQDVSYRDSCEDMGTASFTLALADPMNEEIVVQSSFVRIFDGDEDKGYYRVTDMPEEDDGQGGRARYTCDDAQCTLLDRQMPGYHQIGDIEMHTQACLEYILSFQNPKRWVLARCDFDDAFTYSFSSANLLDAIYAIGETIVEPHRFIFDSTTTPWQISLVKLETQTSCQLVKSRNALSIRRRISGSVITRLYAYGYGEGDNQLTIAPVNGGKPYIDADTIGDWGIREGTHTDTRQTDPATLLAHTRQLLEQAKMPQVGYTVTAVDAYRYSGQPWDNVRAGALARVLDYRFKTPFDARVLTREKSDVLGDNPSVTFELETTSRSTADELNDLRDTVGIHELYAQGATTMYAQQFADNATPEKPAVMKFRIPTNVVRFNSILLSWDLEKYRSPVKGAAAGGGSERTSSSGGGATVTEPARVVTNDVFTSGPVSGREGPAVDFTTLMYSTAGTTDIALETGAASGTTGSATGNTGTPIGTASGAAMTETGTGGPTTTGSASASVTVNTYTAYTSSSSPATDSAGTHSHTVSSHTHSISGHRHTLGTDASYTGYYYLNDTGSSSPGTGSNGSHSHTVDSHSHEMTHKHTASDAGHTHSLEQHSHGINHYHAIGSHTHSLGSHTHSIPDHRHGIEHVHKAVVSLTIPALTFMLEAHSHSVTIPEHEHDAIYDIFEGTRAESISLIVDGTTVPPEDIGDADEIDICKYMRANDEGKIVRGAWHTVQVVPDQNTRVVLNLFVQVFLQSRGAGDY